MSTVASRAFYEKESARVYFTPESVKKKATATAWNLWCIDFIVLGMAEVGSVCGSVVYHHVTKNGTKKQVTTRVLGAHLCKEVRFSFFLCG